MGAQKSELRSSVFLRGLWRALLGVGAVSFILYAVTLSPGLYPGLSAEWTAAAMGVKPWDSAEYPLWRMCAGLWCHLPFGRAVWRLNLSSAVYGALAAVLLCRYVAQWVYARISSSDAKRAKKESLVAIVSGVVAAVLFGTGLTGWSAATRFHPGLFSLVLVLLALTLHQDYLQRHGLSRVYALAFLCGLGAVETPMFLVITPFFIITVLVFFYRHHRLNTNTCLGLLVTGLLGASLYVLFAWLFSRALDPALGGAGGWESVLRAVAKRQLAELRAFAPGVGWPIVLLFVAAPWVAFQTGYWSKLHNYRDYRADGLQFLMVVVVLLLQFNTPIPPWPAWLHAQRLPVLEAALLSMLGGWACAYWLYGCLFDWDSVVIVSAKQRSSLAGFIRLKKRQSLVVGSMFGLLLLVAVCSNEVRASGNRGAFADRCAQEVLEQLGGRTWLVTDGILDTHFTLLAAEQGRPLHLLNLAMDQDALEVRRLRRAVADDPRLQPYRARLLNAASLGVATFLREWLAVDPDAHQALALYGVPDFWVEAGMTVCPDRFLYLAVRSADDLQNRPFLEEHRAFWKHMGQWLPLTDRENDPADSLRRLLRRHLALVANDVGVLLMDLKRMEEAYGAFEEALVLEPESLSAKLNLQVLVEQGLHPNEKEMVEAAAKKALAALKRQPTTFEVVRAYGQIRSAQALASVGEAWARLGQYGLAQGSYERAIALSDDDGYRTALLASLGAVRLTTRDIARSEAVFNALVKSQPGNPAVLLGMLNLALLQGNTVAARDWLGKARVAGADPSILVLTEARIDIAERKYDACYALLLEFTDRVPQNIDGWTLMAAAMIEQGRFDEVERQVLPKMEKLAHQPGNPQVLQVRGAVARAKGPAFYAVAREAYRGALGLLPGRRSLLEVVLDLDLVMGDEVSAEKDARALLRVDRDHPRAHFVLGTQAVARGDLDAGEWHLRSSLLMGGAAATWNNLADLMRQKGALDEAEDAARQALSKAEKNAPFLETLAAILLEKGKVGEAKKFIDQARALAPEDWQVAFTEARILMKAGQPEEARILLRQVQGHVESLPQAAQIEISRVSKEWKTKR